MSTDAATPIQIVIDATDPLAQARFWAEVLGWDVNPEADEHAAYVGGPKRPPGSAPLAFYQVPEDKTVKNRAHLDLTADDLEAEVERLVGELPAGFGLEWTAVSYQEREAGAQTPLLYSLSLLIVFLCLAALYESWSIPTAVLLVAPIGILGAALAKGKKDE